MCAAAAGEPATPERWCCVTSRAKTFLDDVESPGGPPPHSIQSRVTIDLHTHDMIGNHGYADGRPTAAERQFPPDIDPMDTTTYFYCSPQTARECRWAKTPAGVVNLVDPRSAPNRGRSVFYRCWRKTGGGPLPFEPPPSSGKPGGSLPVRPPPSPS
eukprot:927147-Pyramimonas_sp.AAC.1